MILRPSGIIISEVQSERGGHNMDKRVLLVTPNETEASETCLEDPNYIVICAIARPSLGSAFVRDTSSSLI